MLGHVLTAVGFHREADVAPGINDYLAHVEQAGKIGVDLHIPIVFDHNLQEIILQDTGIIYQDFKGANPFLIWAIKAAHSSKSLIKNV